MRLVLEQTFPLGRFHATPWKVFPYDDPHGEWPPSPWRLVRAVLARSFQLDREFADSQTTHDKTRDALVRAFAASEIAWVLPPSTWRGPGLRQYHPAEFKRVPAGASEPGMMAYNTTKALDNFWVTAGPSAEPVIWVFESSRWNDELLVHLDACLARITYFGRAESITAIRRIPATHVNEAALRKALPRRTAKAVPVLGLRHDATLCQLGATTDDAEVAGTNTPPGARWLYFERPPRPRIHTVPQRKLDLPPVSLIQFAIGCNVAPRYRDAVRITERFRSRVLANFTRLLTGDPKAKWTEASHEVLERASALSGKNTDGTHATGHRHASFFLCGEPDAPSRLCVWRAAPFDALEQRAILDAANRPLPLSYNDDPWTITLVPLDKSVPPPPALDDRACRTWQTLTPFVPPRHVFDRKGKAKTGCSIGEQLTAELTTRGYDVRHVAISSEDAGWVKVHRMRCRDGSATNDDKRGYQIKLTFTAPQRGPIALGKSCHFGLGLFAPADPTP
jgi:CRISPR-associated protein Csb2